MGTIKNPLAHLQPTGIWEHFFALTQVPRPTFAEERVRQHLLDWAKQRDYWAKTDKKGNLLVTVPAQGKPAGAPQLILQSHIDMVCEQNADSKIDPRRQGLDVYVDGDWVKARGTTLGADNGIGVAAALAIADDKEIQRGPLQLLFTVEEEVGLNGAKEVDPSFLAGKYLINLDGDIDALLTACAGTFNATVTLALRRQTVPTAKQCYLLSVSGLKGGHSGIDIHEPRGNAIRLLTTLLQELATIAPLDLIDIKGGQSPNAIPRNANCCLYLDVAQAAAAQELLKARQIAWRIHPDEKELLLTLAPVTTPVATTEQSAPLADANRLLDLIAALPNGPLEFSTVRDNYPDTSNNVGIIVMKDDTIVITVKGRSRLLSSLQQLRQQIISIANLAGATFSEFSYSPPWSGVTSSPLIDACQTTFKQLFKQSLPRKVIHGVIECGHFAAKAPHLDMISIGAAMEECHSPNERLQISSVPKFYLLLKQLVEEFSG